MTSYVLAIDQGTTSTRALLFRADTSVAALAQREFPQHFPADAEVEHEPEDLWTTTVETCRGAMREAGVTARDIVAIGITNQRETTLLWDRATGRPVHRAIVWQDRRTADLCASLKAAGHEPAFAAKTGLLLDPYFSGTKLTWLLASGAGVRDRAERGELAFGTVDTYLLWRLTGGKVHATDATNASRTLLFDIHQGRWDDGLLKLLGVPRAVLPEVRDCSTAFGMTDPELLGGSIPICGIAGDQHAALIGQACFTPGMVKSTYGTGCFALLHTGDTPVPSKHKLLTTVAYQLDGKRSYALEGSIFVAGAAVQWLRDGLHIVKTAGETDELAPKADPTQEVILVPAFVGLGAPYWRPDARGALFGLTRATGPRELAQAALESVCFQIRRSPRRDESRLARGRNRAQNFAGRRRHGEFRLDDATARRSARQYRRPAANQGDHGAWRGLSRRFARRLFSRAGSLCATLAAGAAVLAADGCRHPRAKTCRMEFCGAPPARVKTIRANQMRESQPRFPARKSLHRNTKLSRNLLRSTSVIACRWAAGLQFGT